MDVEIDQLTNSEKVDDILNKIPRSELHAANAAKAVVNSVIDQIQSLITTKQNLALMKTIAGNLKLLIGGAIDIGINGKNEMKLNEILDNLNEMKSNNNVSQPTKSMDTYANIVRRKPKQKTIFVKPKTGNDITTTQTKINEIIRKDKTIQISDMLIINDKIKISSTNEKTMEKISNLSDLIVEEELRQDPMIKLVVRAENYENIETTKIRNQIPPNEKLTEISNNEFESKNGTKLRRIIYRMTPGALSVVDQNGRFFAGNEAIKFHRHFSVKICTSCWSTDHRKRQCNATKENTNTGNGMSSPSECPQCPLCLKNGEKDEDKMTHSPLSSNCPVYKKLIIKAQRKTFQQNGNN